MTTFKFYRLILLLSITGCNPISDEKNNQKSNFQCNRIIISFYDNHIPGSKGQRNYGPFSTEVIYETKDEKVLSDFKQMTTLAEKTEYCCCPDRNYTISFYDKTNKYEDYFVDTVEFKDKVRIYEADYQFSYILDKRKWLHFLTELKEISFNQYFISDLQTARKIYAYTIENNLPIITSNRVSKEWMNFDGDFKVKVATAGENIYPSKVYANIKQAYNKDKYKIETISRYQMCGSYDGNDCYNEIILQIFCNKDFFDKFKIYGPKSFYDEAIAEFYVLGTREELDQLEIIANKHD